MFVFRPMNSSLIAPCLVFSLVWLSVLFRTLLSLHSISSKSMMSVMSMQFDLKKISLRRPWSRKKSTLNFYPFFGVKPFIKPFGLPLSSRVSRRKWLPRAHDLHDRDRVRRMRNIPQLWAVDFGEEVQLSSYKYPSSRHVIFLSSSNTHLPPPEPELEATLARSSAVQLRWSLIAADHAGAIIVPPALP
jgi:hypothetical protein